VTAAQLLIHLRQLDATISTENGQLVVNGPKGAFTEELRAQLTAHKAELIELLKNVDARGATFAESKLPQVSRDRDLPLSFAQRRLWFLDQLEPGGTVYNVPAALRIKGPLAFETLQRSLNEIVARHEALRTTFAIAKDEPVQIIAQALDVSLPVIDIGGRDEMGCEEEATRLAAAEMGKPFDLRRGPLFRAALLRFGDDDHVLILTLHHIVADGWSRGILYRELSALYRAFSKRQPSPLVDLPIQYADFAAWQRDWLSGEVLDAQLSYWKKQLYGVPAILNFPTDRPRPTQLSYRGARQSIEFSWDLTLGLKALSLQEGVTLYMTLLTAFQILLHRYTGQDDILVGSPIANRNRTEIEGLIGFFVNTLVLRTDHSGNPTFLELLHRVKESVLDAFNHQDLPFEKLVEELGPVRDLSHSPLFQAMFAFQNVPPGNFDLEGFNIRPMMIAGETTKFDLTVTIHEAVPGLRTGLQYCTDLFDDATMVRVLTHLRNLLEGIVANPEQPISELPLLSKAERHQLLVEWNDTKSEFQTDECIHELFERQVERTPEAIAVEFENQQFTYRELNERANQLAHYLRKFDVGPEELVGVCVERSVEMVIGILGILKAGGAYVPLDPSYPNERLDYMLKDAQVRALLTQQKYLSSVSHPSVVSLDGDWYKIASQSTNNLENGTTSKDIAYVIYTSGSTGQPKGVAIEHRNAVAFLSWAHSVFNREDLSGVLASTSICFDLSVFEIFAPLTCGGSVVLAENALALATISPPTKVSLLNTVPSAMRELLRLEAIPRSVHIINLAGEALRSDLVQRIYESTSVRTLYDLYGPTECTTYSTYVRRTVDGPQTIGRPIANTQIYILDQWLQPVPIGVVGEIYIGGAGVARGYLNRPDLTAERFISHSFGGETDTRLYKTGDLARYLADGNIELTGRSDDQVKIRGYRIELGEIESVLKQHPGIEEAVVVAHEDEPGDRRLVAYCVATKGYVLNPDDAKRLLRTKLPEYMIPAAWVILPSLQRLPNGKLDRVSLPAPEKLTPERLAGISAALTPLEKLVAQVWAELLPHAKFGIHDNFFELGGHSLLATQVVVRLSKVLNGEIPLRLLFEAPTIRELALRITSQCHMKTELQSAGCDALTPKLVEPETMSEETI